MEKEELATFDNIAEKVSESINSQFLKIGSVGFVNLILKVFFPEKTYIQRLRQIIYQTITEHEVEYPAKEEGKLPFYRSEIIFTKLCSHVLGKTKSSLEIDYLYDLNDSFIKPNQNETRHFFEIFLRRINSDRLLRKLHQKENHVNEVFVVSSKVDDLNDKFSEFINRDNQKILGTSLMKNLDFPSSLMEKNKPHEALSFLLDYKKNNWNDFTDEIKYKVLNDIGFCYMQLDREKDGAQCLIETFQYNKNDVKAIGSAALGNLLIGNTIEANRLIEIALGFQNVHDYTYATIVMIDDGNSPLEELIRNIPLDAQKKSQVAFSISRHQRKRNEITSSIEWLELAFENDTKNSITIAGALGCAILDMVVTAPENLTNEFRLSIQRSIDLITKAWEPLDNKEMKRVRYYWIMMRGVGKKLLQDFNGAYSDIKEAANLERNHYTLRNLALVANEIDRTYETIALFEELQKYDEFDGKSETTLMLAEAYATMNRIEESIQLVSTVQSMVTDQKLYVETACLLVRFYLSIGNVEKAKETNIELVNLYGEQAGSHFNNATINGHLGNMKQCHADLQLAVNSVLPDQRYLYHAIANSCYISRYFPGAISLYEKFVERSIMSPNLKKLIDSYFYQKMYSQVLEIAQKIRNQGVYDPNLIEREIFIFNSFSQYDQIIAVCEEYFQHELQDDQINAWAATAYLKKDNKQDAINCLKRIKSLIEFPVWNAFRIANLFIYAGMKNEGLNFLYELRRHHYNDHKAHSLYLTSFLQAGNEESINFEKIECECAITIITDNGATTFIIEDRKDTIASHGELKLSDPIAQNFIGKMIGEVVTLDAFGLPLECTIQEIVHKYVFAHHKSQDLLATVFAHEADLRVFSLKGETDEERIQNMKSFIDSQIDRNAERSRMIIENYKSGILSIGGFANLSGKNEVEIWAGLTNDSQMGIFSGIVGELNNLQENLLLHTVLVIDVSTLLTISALKLFDFYSNRKNRLIVGQKSLDTLHSYIESINIGDGSQMTIAKEGDNYIHFEMPREQINKQISIVDSILNWVNQNCEILSSSQIINLEVDYREQLTFMLGDSSFESIMLAKEYSGILIAEEAVIRSVALQEFKLSSLTTQFILRFSMDENLVSREEYDHFCKNLLRLNFNGILIDANFLLFLIKESDYILTYEFKLATDVLTGKVSNENSIIVGCNFLKILYLENIEQEKLEEIVWHIFESLVSGRDVRLISLALNQIIPRIFDGMGSQKLHIVMMLYAFVTENIDNPESSSANT